MILKSRCIIFMFHAAQLALTLPYRSHELANSDIEDFISKLLKSDKFGQLTEKFAEKAAEKIKTITEVRQSNDDDERREEYRTPKKTLRNTEEEQEQPNIAKRNVAKENEEKRNFDDKKRNVNDEKLNFDEGKRNKNDDKRHYDNEKLNKKFNDDKWNYDDEKRYSNINKKIIDEKKNANDQRIYDEKRNRHDETGNSDDDKNNEEKRNNEKRHSEKRKEENKVNRGKPGTIDTHAFFQKYPASPNQDLTLKYAHFTINNKPYDKLRINSDRTRSRLQESDNSNEKLNKAFDSITNDGHTDKTWSKTDYVYDSIQESAELKSNKNESDIDQSQSIESKSEKNKAKKEYEKKDLIKGVSTENGENFSSISAEKEVKKTSILQEELKYASLEDKVAKNFDDEDRNYRAMDATNTTKHSAETNKKIKSSSEKLDNETSVTSTLTTKDSSDDSDDNKVVFVDLDKVSTKMATTKNVNKTFKNINTKHLIRRENGRLFTFQDSPDYKDYHDELAKVLSEKKILI